MMYMCKGAWVLCSPHGPTKRHIARDESGVSGVSRTTLQLSTTRETPRDPRRRSHTHTLSTSRSHSPRLVSASLRRGLAVAQAGQGAAQERRNTYVRGAWAMARKRHEITRTRSPSLGKCNMHKSPSPHSLDIHLQAPALPCKQHTNTHANHGHMD